MSKASIEPTPRGREIERKCQEAVREALLDHSRAGNPVAILQNGHVVIVPPGKIPELLNHTRSGEI